MKLAILGIGNTLACDDGVGIRIVREVLGTISDRRVACFECERSGLDLLDALENADKAIVVDAARTQTCPPGTVWSFRIRQPFSRGTSSSLHTVGLDSVLGFGLMAGVKLPDEVTVYAMEVEDIETFGASCTPSVEAAVPLLVARVKNQIMEYLSEVPSPVSGTQSSPDVHQGVSA